MNVETTRTNSTVTVGIPSIPFWKRVGLLTVGQTTEKAVQMILVVLLVRIVAPSAWNVVALSLTVYFAALTIGSFNLEQSVLFFLPRFDRARQDALIARTTLMLAASGAVIGLAVLIIGSMTSVLGARSVSLLLGLAIAVEMPTVIAGPVLVLRSRISAAGAWDTGQSLAQLACVLVPALAGASAQGIVGGLAVAGTIRLVGYVIVFRDLFDAQRRLAGRSVMIEQIMFCLPLGVALAAGALARLADKWILAWRVPADLGLFVVAAQEIPILAVLPYAGGAAIAVALAQRLSAGDWETAHRLWFRQAAAMCRSVVPLTISLALVAPEVFGMLFGSRFDAAIFTFQVFTLVGLHRVTEYGMVLRAAGRTRDVALSSIVLLGCCVAFGVPAALIGGMRGLTFSTLGAFIVAWWWILGRVANVFGKRRSTVFPWTDWSVYVFVYGSAALVLHQMTERVMAESGRLALKLAVFGALVVAVEMWRRGRPRVGET